MRLRNLGEDEIAKTRPAPHHRDGNRTVRAVEGCAITIGIGSCRTCPMPPNIPQRIKPPVFHKRERRVIPDHRDRTDRGADGHEIEHDGPRWFPWALIWADETTTSADKTRTGTAQKRPRRWMNCCRRRHRRIRAVRPSKGNAAKAENDGAMRRDAAPPVSPSKSAASTVSKDRPSRS